MTCLQSMPPGIGSLRGLFLCPYHGQKLLRTVHLQPNESSMAKIKLADISTRAPKDFDKTTTKEKTHTLLQELRELQNLLYAANSHSLLVVIQGMDASGKDGAVRTAFSTTNPQGVMVRSFKAPTEV